MCIRDSINVALPPSPQQKQMVADLADRAEESRAGNVEDVDKRQVLNMAAVIPQPEDYTGEDGLLYCGKCHTPKEAYFPEKQAALFGRDRHPAE